MYFKNRNKYLILECECGNIFEVTWNKFNRNDSKPKRQCNSCSLLLKKSKNINKIINNFYILDSYSVPTDNSNKTIYKVKCIFCELMQERMANKVLSGNAKCDCQKEFIQRNCDRNTRLGNIYHGMLDRCENPNNDGYKYYGSKGISVCDEWQTFEPFKEWSLDNGYDDVLTIDRINYNEGYSPDNCRWATYKTQANNKTDNHMIIYNDKTKNIQTWSEELGIKANTLLYRIRRGWTIERAFNTPVNKN